MSDCPFASRALVEVELGLRVADKDGAILRAHRGWAFEV
jgi:hypothetical protein